MTNYNDGNWHGWNGGECPVHPETVVEVVFNKPSEKPYYEHSADNVYWENGKAPSDIIAFRVIKEHKEPREFWIYPARQLIQKDKPTVNASSWIHVREVIE